MLIDRDRLGRFLSKTPSSYKYGTRNEEDNREGAKDEVQLSFWNDISFPEDNHTLEYL